MNTRTRNADEDDYLSTHRVVIQQLWCAQLKGRRAVNVQSILEQYDRTGAHTKLIGATVFMLHKDHMGTRCVIFDTQPSRLAILSVILSHAWCPYPFTRMHLVVSLDVKGVSCCQECVVHLSNYSIACRSAHCSMLVDLAKHSYVLCVSLTCCCAVCGFCWSGCTCNEERNAWPE